jgi:hypothetical protein
MDYIAIAAGLSLEEAVECAGEEGSPLARIAQTDEDAWCVLDYADYAEGPEEAPG